MSALIDDAPPEVCVSVGLLDAQMHPNVNTVYLHLKRLADGSSQAAATTIDLARSTNLAPATITKALRVLREEGWISSTKTRTRGGRSSGPTLFTLHDAPVTR